ncbi:hypothetical protein SAMN05444172_8782 [Burkholderia sp. GAS332]|nr:hypothetical protein SAMN05444172_8782 [Burkholderia sp. GAS332]
MGLNVIDADIDELVALRRDIHGNPETTFDETRTSELVAAKLCAWDIETHTGVGKTGRDLRQRHEINDVNSDRAHRVNLPGWR